MDERAAAAPIGATCAVHADRSARTVCVRCGNFMCVECSENQQHSLCPSCRALSPEETFPLRRDAFDVNAAWSLTFEAWKREWVMLSVAALVFVGIVIAGSVAANIISRVISAIANVSVDPVHPFASLSAFTLSTAISMTVGTLINAFALGIAMLGFLRVVMDVLLGRKADVGRMFVNAHKVPRYAAMHLIQYMIISVPLLMFMVAMVVVAFSAAGYSLSTFDLRNALAFMTGTGAAVFFFGSIVVFAFSIWVMPLTLFSPMEMVISDAGPIEIMKRVWKVGSGQRLRLFGYAFLSGLVVVIGVVLCCLPVLPAISLAYGLLVALYLGARNGTDLPAADHK